MIPCQPKARKHGRPLIASVSAQLPSHGTHWQKHAVGKLPCVSFIADGLERQTSNGSRTSRPYLTTCTPLAESTTSALTPYTQAPTISSNCYHDLGDSNTRNGIRPSSTSACLQPEDLSLALARTLASKIRMWRRWHVRQSVPKRRRLRGYRRKFKANLGRFVGLLYDFYKNYLLYDRAPQRRFQERMTTSNIPICAWPGPKSWRGDSNGLPVPFARTGPQMFMPCRAVWTLHWREG